MRARHRCVSVKFIAVFSWFFAATLVSAHVSAALGEDAAPPSIVVYGTAEAQVKPDRMVWHVTVHNQGAKLPAVAAEHAKMVRAMLEFLKQTGINGTDVQTSQMNFGEHEEHRNGSWIKDGYEAETNASFMIKELGKYEMLWMGLAELAGVSVESVVFDHSQRVEYQNDTRRKALLAARDKAADLASTLGVQLGEPLYIEEDYSLHQTWGSNRAQAQVNTCYSAGGGDDMGDTLAPGTISIRTRVRATFRLISPATDSTNPSGKEPS